MATATKTKKKSVAKKPTYQQLENELADVKQQRAEIQAHTDHLQRRWAENLEKAVKSQAQERQDVELVARGLDIERVELIARAERLALRIKGLGFNPRP
jgi:septal ring factor EnvC (AmiA/AmiB activator)